jgi:hypothetical protein
VDNGDGAGFVEAAYCVPSDPAIKPGEWGYRACGDCSKGLANPALVPGVWKGTATLTRTRPSFLQDGSSDQPLEWPLIVALSDAPGATLDVKISDPRALRSAFCIDVEGDHALDVVCPTWS